MKRIILSVTGLIMFCVIAFAQNDNVFKTVLAKLDQASTVKDYQQLADQFNQLGNAQKTQWLPYYYAAFCNAKIGWLYEDDGEKIEPFADIADGQIKKAQSLLDTAKQKKELSEIYCVISMTNRARVFINPSTYGRQYG